MKKNYDDEIKKKAKADYKRGIPIKDISEKYSIPYSTVQTWRKNYWQNIKGNDKRKVTAPKNNSRAGKGPYATLILEGLTEEEREIFYSKGKSPEEQIQEEINLLTIREYRILKTLNEYRDKNEYKAKEIQIGEKSSYINEKGKKVRVEKHIDNSINIILRLEAELTKIQGKKSASIEKLAKLKLDKGKAENDEDLMSIWLDGIKKDCHSNE